MLTIYTPSNSYAEKWAKQNSLGLEGFDENGTLKYKERWAKMYGIACKPISSGNTPKKHRLNRFWEKFKSNVNIRLNVRMGQKP